MAHAYSPGLKVTNKILLRKKRRLPLKGDVLVKVGQKVKASDVVAQTNLPGNVEALNVANKLSVPAEEIKEYMLKKVGESMEKGEMIAQTNGFFGLFKSSAISPVSGTIESISHITGQVILREPPIPVAVKAYIDGEVIEILENEGVIVETPAAFVQGIFGIGPEVHGPLQIITEDTNKVLQANDIPQDVKGKILVGGAMVTVDAINKAIEQKAVAIVTGGIDAKDLKDFLGYDLGVAITGNEEKGITLVITEGFGKMRMASFTYDLFKSLEGRIASAHGATQIRAGVIRPEVVIPLPELSKESLQTEQKEMAIVEIDSPIRAIRVPYFGNLGRIKELPAELEDIDSEAHVRIFKVLLEDGKEVTIPRANVEIIEH